VRYRADDLTLFGGRRNVAVGYLKKRPKRGWARGLVAGNAPNLDSAGRRDGTLPARQRLVDDLRD
jgi:hypothetical protein